MKVDSTHTIFKVLALTLVFAILTPSLVKFSHGFQNHEHEVCYGEFSSHLHEIDIDCEFYKFKLNNQFVFNPKSITFLEVKQTTAEIISQYRFINDYQKLQTSLRGPPVTV